MKLINSSKILLIIASMSLLAFCFNAPAQLDLDKEKVIEKVRKVLTFLHFKPKALNNNFSENVYHRYLENIDPFKRLFTQEDVKEFEVYKDELDNAFETSDLTFYNLTLNRLFTRINQGEKFVNEILVENLDFEQEDYLVIDEDKKQYPKNEKELKNEWRRYIKYLILNEIQSNEITILNDSLDINTSIKKDDPYYGKTKEEKIELAKKEVKEDMDEYFRRYKIRNKDDIFTTYVNAFTEEYDPHTSYFSPKAKEEFDTQISGKFEGIGATLLDDKGFATITSLIVGGPAWKTKQVEANDIILEVAQGKEEPVNIVGMPLDEAIRLIRGKKGTKVILTLKKANGSLQKTEIIRDEIEIEESFAKSVILEDENGNKHGLISFNSFYVDVNSRNGRNVSDDIKAEIIELKKENIQSITLDVRNNGGGSLQEVVEIVGLFIKNGPVVQTRISNEKPKVLSDEDNGAILWEGPLAVMINEFSASASEILAGAIKDYKRGVIIGSKQTYGKGTVQQIFALDRFSSSASESGDLKLTIQKFYRINGSSTQIKGVEADIVIPNKYIYAEINEGFQDNALEWDQITKANYNLWEKPLDIALLKRNSELRTQSDDYVRNILDEANWIQKINKEEKISLHYNEFMKNVSERKNQLDVFGDKEKFNFKLKVNPLENEMIKFKTDTIYKEKRENWYKQLKKDYYLQETIAVLNDVI